MNDIKLHKQKRMKYDNTIQQSHDVIKRRVCANGTMSYGIKHSIHVEENVSYNVDSIFEKNVYNLNPIKYSTIPLDEEVFKIHIKKNILDTPESMTREKGIQINNSIEMNSKTANEKISKLELNKLKVAANNKYKLSTKNLPEPFPFLSKISSRIAINNSKGFLNNVMENYNYDYNHQVKNEELLDAIKVKKRKEKEGIDEDRLINKHKNNEKQLVNLLINMNNFEIKSPSLSDRQITNYSPIVSQNETTNQKIIENFKFLKDSCKTLARRSHQNCKRILLDSDKKSHHHTNSYNFKSNNFFKELSNQTHIIYSKQTKHKKNSSVFNKETFFITGNPKTERSNFNSERNDLYKYSNTISNFFKTKSTSKNEKGQNSSFFSKYKFYNNSKINQEASINKNKSNYNFAKINHNLFQNKLNKFIKIKKPLNSNNRLNTIPVSKSSLDKLFLTNTTKFNEEALNSTINSNFFSFKHSQHYFSLSRRNFKFLKTKNNKISSPSSIISSTSKKTEKTNLFQNSIIKENVNAKEINSVNLKLYIRKVELKN